MTIRALLLALPLLFAGWMAVMATVMLVSDAAPGAVALFPAPDFMASLPDGVAVMAAGRFHVTVKSAAPGLGTTLYDAGARLVLPAGLVGCLPLPKPVG